MHQRDKSTRASQRLLQFCVVLLALLLRANSLDSLRYFHDHGVPHGLGIMIVESIQLGRWQDLPTLSFASGVGVQNPVLGSYLWALVAIFDRDPFTASMVSVLLNVTGVAMVLDLGRRSFGHVTGIVAGTIMASSPWSIQFAQGAWMQGQLEFWSIATAWLLFRQLRSNQWLVKLAPWIVAAIASQTYLMGFGVLVQLLGAALFLRSMHRAALVGLMLCAASAAIFVITLFIGQPDLIAELQTGIRLRASAQPFSLDTGLWHALSLASGSGFPVGDFMLGGQRLSLVGLLEVRKALIASMVFLGALAAFRLAIIRGPSQTRAQALLGWFLLPCSMIALIGVLRPGIEVVRQYLLIASPAAYVLAGVAFHIASKRMRHWRSPIAMSLMTFIVSTGVISIHIYTSALRTTPLEREPVSRKLYVEYLSLNAQRQAGSWMRENCAEVVNPQLRGWQTSILGSSQRIRVGAAEVNGESDSWQVPGNGGACLLRIDEEPAPPLAASTLVVRDAKNAAWIHQSLPIDEASLGRFVDSISNSPLMNIGWRLHGLRYQNVVNALAPISITQAWQIETIPEWLAPDTHFTVFASAIRADGMRVKLVEAAPLPHARLWREGDWVLSTLRFKAPGEPGDYTVEISLFDAQRGENAAYLDAAGPRVAHTLNLRVIP